MELMRCFGSGHIWVWICLVLVACCLYPIGSWRDIINNRYGVYSVLSVVEQMVNFDRFKSLILLAVAFIYSGSFCDDCQNNYYHFIGTRASLKKYAFTKVFVNGIGVFLTVMTGILMFSLILSQFIPMYVAGDGITISGYQGGIGSLIYIILPFSLGSVFLTTLGLFFSAFVPDKLIVYTIPFLGNYLFSALTFNTGENGLFFLGLMSSNLSEIQEVGLLNIARKSIIFLIFTLMLSVGFYIGLKRRIEHENYK
ncbi:hypothetical protein [Konateibacter massiliensis]|uniref:hypothetical protein n=1 Tax=Konateibacter massiliensis TaxID=2002841 RepID=UPI000C15958F|nr:hypothetical protein [Konateibacter massiliensis]